MNKPVAESCLQNQQVILEVLQALFTEPGEVLEVGSGTGQHAVYFTEHMPHLIWQPGDLEDQIAGMKMWFAAVDHGRIREPMLLDVDADPWAVDKVDYVFTANTIHIISTPQVERLFQQVAPCMKPGALFAQYGPFNYNGNYTSESNARFDVWLKQRNPDSCIKHFEDLQALADKYNMRLFKDVEMPANNRILVWQMNA